jgi:hypothetical protein
MARLTWYRLDPQYVHRLTTYPLDICPAVASLTAMNSHTDHTLSQQGQHARHAPIRPIEPRTRRSSRIHDHAHAHSSAAELTVGASGPPTPFPTCARFACHLLRAMVHRRRRRHRAAPTPDRAPRAHVRRAVAHAATPPRALRTHRPCPSWHLPRRSRPRGCRVAFVAASHCARRRAGCTRDGGLARIWGRGGGAAQVRGAGGRGGR